MFVHLHCHSHYSFLRAVPSPAEIIAAAAEHAMPAVALTDTGGLYAAVPFYLAAREAGVKPIVGAVLEIETGNSCGEIPRPGRAGARDDTQKIDGKEQRAAAGGNETLVLLAADHTGYSNLCHLVTERQLQDQPVSLKVLSAHHDGVIALYAPQAGGAESSAPVSVAERVAQLKETFGPALYLEAQHLSPGGGRALREALRLGRELDVPLVATNNVHFLRPEEHLHHRVLNAIRTGSLLTTVAPPDIASTQAYFKSVEEMRRAFADHPEALRATLEIAERCNLKLELGKLIFPAFPVPEDETPFSYLWKLCFEGAKQRYRPLRPEVLARLTHELEVIQKRSLAPYFLLVWDIVEEARRRGIPAVARGSAASSIVTYCLGISRVCPLRWGLYFERFLNEQRGDCPDIDLDLCGARRDELLDYVYKRWGAEHVAMIASFITMHARLAVREVANKGIVVTQYDMNAVEALGLIKMDLLGQRGLTTMSLALEEIELASGKPLGEARGKRVDFDTIPEADPATCAMISQGRTMGVFQIESPGMRGLLRTLEARALDDMAVALALIRPGASEYGAKETFLKRLRKQEPVRYAHSCLKAILGETLGVCVYQEQVMQIAQAVGSMSLAEADLVRRTTTKFADQRERERLRAKFLKAAERMDLEGAQREQTWQMVEKFAGFGFCKAHAATYADLSYRIAYLKAHHPAEFLAAMCSSGAGFYHVSAYVEEAKRWGIEVRLPSVNHSRLEYTTEASASGTTGRAIRIGLMQVKGLRLETIEKIAGSREQNGPYRSLEDFLRRVPVERDAIESLIKCGAFDEVGEEAAGDAGGVPDPHANQNLKMTRPALLWRLNLLRARGLPPAAPTADTLFPEALQPAPHEANWNAWGMAAADYTREQRLRYEQEILEVCVSGHPLDRVARNAEAWSSELPHLRGQRVTLLGWVVTFRHVGTKDYRNMMFVTLEDQRGLYEAVLFPGAYERYGGLVFETRTLRVTGRVEPDGQINCEKLEAAG